MCVSVVHQVDNRSMRILVAEDDSALRSVLERGLRERGYVVDAVADGDAALGYLRIYDYEVAVLDWRMPQQSGLDVLREVRRRGSPLPILMLTARDSAGDRVTGLDEGADEERSRVGARRERRHGQPARHPASAHHRPRGAEMSPRSGLRLSSDTDKQRGWMRTSHYKNSINGIATMRRG